LWTRCSSEHLLMGRYDVMSQCWYENPAHRPSFGLIRHQLDVLLGHHRNYLDLDNLDMSPAMICDGTTSPLPTSVQLVYDDDDEECREREDSYIDSSPLVGDADSPSSRTSLSSSTRDLPMENACRVWICQLDLDRSMCYYSVALLAHPRFKSCDKAGQREVPCGFRKTLP